MQTAVLLVVLASIGGAVVLRSVLNETAWGGVSAAESLPQPKDTTRRRRRRLLTTTALTAALAVEAEEDVRPSFLDRTFAFVRLLLVIAFVCALAGGTILWIATTLARMFGHQSG
jgi:hypothetical protein